MARSDISADNIEQMTKMLKEEENIMLFSEINKMVQTIKGLDKKVFELGTKNTNDELQQYFDLLKHLSETKTLPEYGTKLTDQYSKLSTFLRDRMNF